LYTMAVFFLVFLYNSPSGLVFYWTLNNVFSLVKTIFYKLKNPRKVLNIMLAIAGVVVMGLGVMSLGRIKSAYVLVVWMVALVMMMPLILSIIGKRRALGNVYGLLTADTKGFFISMVYMAVLVGGLIPSTVINSSPQEFIVEFVDFHPNMYITSAMCYAIGFFVVWMGVFYWITEKENKCLWNAGSIALCGIATLDYFVFHIDLGRLSKTLQYESDFAVYTSTLLINTGVVLIVIATVLGLYPRFRNLIPRILSVVIIAYVVVCGMNVVHIARTVEPFVNKEDRYAVSPTLELSATGQNVVVIMLDRAMGEYLPYIMDERPQLKESFSGFTCYTNSLSFGPCTNVASPAVFGGYEYTPEEINKREDVSLKDKQNEALRLMPALFSGNGYDTTVCDPVYANYSWNTDLSIYDDYPEVDAYRMIGNFDGEYSADISGLNRRNFYCYGLMRTLPVFFQKILYDEGNYLHKTNGQLVCGQAMYSDTVASGFYNETYENYKALCNLSSITEVSEDSDNHFLMFRNDLPHDPQLLQLPDYEMTWDVDNSAYMDVCPDKLTLGDGSQSLDMKTMEAYKMYHVNMATLIKLGDWLDYLKEQGAYDNTRIIIVADHGEALGNIDSMIMPHDENSDLGYFYKAEAYYPMMLVKDFNATDFGFSDEFMTNADVPSLAMEGIIDNPVNPFTGNPVSNDRKYAGDMYVLGEEDSSIYTNNGNVFKGGIWFSVHDDMRDMNNWMEVQRDAVLPY
ncbi:MAG: sulfatase-like hydrolase/transferase, partial [Pseudobutyrivibrio sp.]|nr:sulfatase-like hydrolase/transferase [Pseudobutyrivibrio sp.]